MMKRKICFILFMVLFVLGSNAQQPKQDGEVISPPEDADGNIYTSVTIGKQTWLVENLKTTRYLNGDVIPTTTPANRDISGEAEPKYQWAYNGDERYAEIYGRLYTWYAISDERGVCPAGWHVPTDRDWSVLTDFLGRDLVAGGKLKAEGTEFWAEPNTGATNETGFTALPGGARNLNGSFYNVMKFGAWWTASSSDSGAFYRNIEYDDPNVFRNYFYSSKNFGFAVRCIKN
jgi:uncharacterized protein (TIGR02145 family)